MKLRVGKYKQVSDSGGSSRLEKLLPSAKLSQRRAKDTMAACRREDPAKQQKTLWLSELMVAEISLRGGDKPQAQGEPGTCWTLTVRFPGHFSSSSLLQLCDFVCVLWSIQGLSVLRLYCCNCSYFLFVQKASNGLFYQITLVYLLSQVSFSLSHLVLGGGCWEWHVR